jgi:tyrosyl-tRNA synthetase
MTTMDAAARLALIRENLDELLNPEIIEKILAEGGNPKIYWGESTYLNLSVGCFEV